MRSREAWEAQEAVDLEEEEEKHEKQSDLGASVGSKENNSNPRSWLDSPTDISNKETEGTLKRGT